MMMVANLLFITGEYFIHHLDMSSNLGKCIVSMFAAPAAFLWGGQMTAIQGLFLSIISEKVDMHLRGTAIGIYYTAIGLSFMVASKIAGHIWHGSGCVWSFMYSIFFCVLAMLLFKPLLPKMGSVKSK
jgi:MFS family permease